MMLFFWTTYPTQLWMWSNKLEALVGKEVPFLLGDLRNPGDIEMAFMECDIDCVIHFAGLKAVGESVKMPDLYYANNVGGTTNLIKAMTRHGVKKMVFSSSATVYGDPGDNTNQRGFPAERNQSIW
jgi:UDP-glucose 4-epimerase